MVQIAPPILAADFARLMRAAGAHILAAGTTIFRRPDYAQAIRVLQE